MHHVILNHPKRHTSWKIISDVIFKVFTLVDCALFFLPFVIPLIQKSNLAKCTLHTYIHTYVCTYMRHCVVFVHRVNFSSSETEWVSLPYWLLFCFFVLFLHFNLLQIIPWHFPFFCMRLCERMFMLLLVLLLPFSFFIKMHNAHETSAQLQWVTATTATLRNCKLCVCTYGKREREW